MTLKEWFKPVEGYSPSIDIGIYPDASNYVGEYIENYPLSTARNIVTRLTGDYDIVGIYVRMQTPTFEFFVPMKDYTRLLDEFRSVECNF